MGNPTVDIFITILYIILIAKLIFWALRVGVHIGGGFLLNSENESGIHVSHAFLTTAPWWDQFEYRK